MSGSIPQYTKCFLIVLHRNAQSEGTHTHTQYDCAYSPIGHLCLCACVCVCANIPSYICMNVSGEYERDLILFGFKTGNNFHMPQLHFIVVILAYCSYCCCCCCYCFYCCSVLLWLLLRFFCGAQVLQLCADFGLRGVCVMRSVHSLFFLYELESERRGLGEGAVCPV